MRRTITFIKNVWFLYRAKKDLSIVNGNHKGFFQNAFRIGKHGKLTQLERDMLAAVVRKLRGISPYQVEDYSEAKEMYDAYFKLDNHINSYDELKEKFNTEGVVYVTKFRSETPVKGERYAEYFINRQGYSRHKVFKVIDIRKYGCRFENDEDISLDERWFTCFKYSTPEEIDSYKIKQTQIKSIRDLIEKNHQHNSELYNQLNDLNE